MALTINVMVECDFCGDETEASMRFKSPYEWEVDAPADWSVETVGDGDDVHLETYCSDKCKNHNHTIAQA